MVSPAKGLYLNRLRIAIKQRVKMQIKSVIPKPYEKSIYPAISFEVEIAFRKLLETIVAIEGQLESDDGKIIANVFEVIQRRRTNDVGAKGSALDSQFEEASYSPILIALLDREAVQHLENRRMKNKKHDVYLTLNLNVKSLTSRARISYLHRVESNVARLPQIRFSTDSGKQVDGKMIVYAYDDRFSTSYNNMWIISGDGGPVFLSINEEILKKENIRINSVDWIHDYAPKLKLGEYFIVEIPKGKMAIKKAWEYVDKAEECYRQWDTKGAYANCREVGKVLSQAVKKKFKNKPTIKKWKRAIDKFETLCSLNLHLEDIKEQKPEGDISIGKPETEHIIIVTKALIKYAEELLQEKS